MDYPILLPDQLKSHLKSLRKARGLTQLQFGALLGLGQVRVAEIEANPAAISVDQLFKLLSALTVGVVLRDSTPVPAAPQTSGTARPGSKPSAAPPAPNKKAHQALNKSAKGRW